MKYNDWLNTVPIKERHKHPQDAKITDWNELSSPNNWRHGWL